MEDFCAARDEGRHAPARGGGPSCCARCGRRSSHRESPHTGKSLGNRSSTQGPSAVCRDTCRAAREGALEEPAGQDQAGRRCRRWLCLRTKSVIAGISRAGWDQAKAKTAGTRIEPHLARVDKWLAARRLPVEGRYRIAVAANGSRRAGTICAVLLCALIALPAFAEPRCDQRSDLHVHDAGARAILEFAGRLRRSRLRRAAGLRGARRLSPVCPTVHGGIDPLAAIVLAGVIAAVIAVPTALVVFRLRGAYFAIGTWVMAEVYRLVFAQFRQLGGGTGTSLPPYVTNEVAGIGWVRGFFDVRTSAARDMITYWAALALAVAPSLRLSDPSLAVRPGACGHQRIQRPPPRASAWTTSGPS